MKHWRAIGMLILAAFAQSVDTRAGEARHINFAAFEKQDPGFRFEPVVLGSFSEFIATMKGAGILMLVHTNEAVDGDVINVQQDVLRESSGADLGDFGINCSLSFKVTNDNDNPFYTLGGVCRFLGVGEKHRNLTATFKPVPLADAAQGVDAWVLLHEDKASGIAFYANVSN